MKLITIQYGQSVWIIPMAGLTAGTLYGPNLTRAFEKKYGFLQGPRTVQEYDIQKGLVFHHGIFNGNVIEKLTIFGDGVVCETKANTAVADSFIADAMAWARSEAGLAIPVESFHDAPRIYLSRVDVQMDIDLDTAVPGFSEVGKAIAAFVTAYGQHPRRDYGVAAVNFHVDNTRQTKPAGPAPFLFERTINQPYESRRYYSAGPLRTDDHLAVLEILESALKR